MLKEVSLQAQMNREEAWQVPRPESLA